MRIAIVAPLCETIPPSKYGGTERVVYFITEELVRLGHTVTLYAASNSTTSAHLIPCFPGTFRSHGIGYFSAAARTANTAQLNAAISRIADHDIIHVHHSVEPYHAELLQSRRNIPLVWTDHNGLHHGEKPGDLEALAKLGVGMTALSESHRSTVPGARWLATIHHGLPVNLLRPQDVVPSYLGFIGRISPEKGITTAVRIAGAAGIELKVAAKVDDVDRAFYDDEVAPLFAGSNVDFIGEISDAEKSAFLSAAVALVFPICWLEPFGLVMIEAMACGCPVVAFRKGSVAEVVEDGVTGFIVDTEEEAAEALQKVGELDRARIRARFEERFTASRMVMGYLEVYERVIAEARILKEVGKLIAKEKEKAGLVKRPSLVLKIRPSSFHGVVPRS